MGWDAKALFASRTPETVQTGEKKNPGPVYILRPFNQKKGEKIELGDLTTTHHIICNGAGDYVIKKKGDKVNQIYFLPSSSNILEEERKKKNL